MDKSPVLPALHAGKHDPVIKGVGLSKAYQRGREEVIALDDVSLQIHEGEWVSLLGPSGSGKSTLLNMIGCLDTPSKGTLAIDGVEVGGKSESELVKVRRHKVGFIFQQFFLLPTLSVRENILLPTLHNHGVDAHVLDNLIEFVGLSHRKNHLPQHLSGGEMQRVAIARALIKDPKIILADEPTGNLDSKTGEKIMELFSVLNKAGVTIVMVTHNEEFAKKAHRVIRIKDGRIHE